MIEAIAIFAIGAAILYAEKTIQQKDNRETKLYN